MSGQSATQIEVSRVGTRLIAQGTAVALAGRGVLITGPSGSGKSALALSLMGLGASLIADDRVEIALAEDGIVLSPPDEIRGRIEARFVGILAADPVAAPLALVVDLAHRETQRLPPARTAIVAGRAIPSLHSVESAYFPAAVAQYLRGGRCE